MIQARHTALSSDRHLVHLSGRFTPGWAGGFARGLTESGLNIESAFAVRDERGLWNAEFELRRTATSLDPAHVDFASLVSAPAMQGILEPIRLLRYTVVRPKGELRLRLELEASDQIGFLAQMLSQLVFLSLFPVEMTIRTEHGVVHDVFYLTGVGGILPPDHAVAGLRRELDVLLGPGPYSTLVASDPQR
jgi:hypothetical protein